MRKIILDVDTGTDDAMAIIAAAKASKDLEIVALTAVNGNQPLPNTLENTLRVVELLGMDIPVYAGCPEPMVMTLAPHRMEKVGMEPIEQVIDGEVVNIHDDYLPLSPATIKEQEQHAVSFMVEYLRKAEEPVTVVAVGPATNVGMALRMAPDIVKNIEEIVIMGGGVRKGNITSAAEFNFFIDPEAAQIMVKADTKITIFPLDATTSILFSKEDGKKLAALGNAPAKFFGEMMVDFCHRMELLGISNVDDPDDHRCALHDVMCVLYLLDPSFVLDMRLQDCEIEFGGGVGDGQLIAEHRSFIPRKTNTQIAYKLDKEKVMSMLLDLLA